MNQPAAPATVPPPGATHPPVSAAPSAALTLAALGVVFGDIGTSPLYALRECFHGPHAFPVNEANVLGVLSLIFWAMNLVISLKYLVFILRADNQGEGGILALAALLTPVRAGGKEGRNAIVVMGLFGAALLYADGMITPAISVLSAVEGLEIATPAVHPYVQLITVVILTGLFLIQSRGTTDVGRLFGPVTLVWFIVLGLLGLSQIVHNPAVFEALNPLHGARFFWHHGLAGFVVLGGVFLVVTGGEALYADLGHFGIKPIRRGWFAVALPALLLNYFGQGAFLIANPGAAEQPFFRMAPWWSLYPLILLATAATVIASQAVITGAFSLTLQAIHLGYCPRLRIEQTSADQKGQIYVPSVNWALMFACIGLVIGFGSSSNLAAAYGIAITITMVITTLLFFALVRRKWGWPLPVALAAGGAFLIIDLAFFSSNITKILHGGWFPLLVAGIVYILMSTWMAGRRLLAKRLRERLIPLELFIAELLSNPPPRVPGTAVFMSTNPIGTPPALRHNVAHNKILHEHIVILTVAIADQPHVDPDKRAEVEEIGEGFFRVQIHYGFMDDSRIPQDLSRAQLPGLTLDMSKVTYFLGRESLFATKKPGMALWRERLFAFMTRNATPATRFFALPAEQVFEVGVQVDL